MKCLTLAFDKKDLEVLFFENAFNLEKLPHSIIEVIALPRKRAADLSIYFKKGMEDMESEWSVHKKIIDIKQDKGGIRK